MEKGLESIAFLVTGGAPDLIQGERRGGVVGGGGEIKGDFDTFFLEVEKEVVEFLADDWEVWVFFDGGIEKEEGVGFLEALEGEVVAVVESIGGL